MRESRFVRGIVAGLSGGVAWFIGIFLFFGPAQIILANPDFQSAKMLAAFSQEPLPRAAEAPWILIAGLLVIGALWGCVYVWIADAWSDARWPMRGWRFAALAWALMVPWFVFYLPWNVLREPAPLALLEMACWAGVMTCVGLTIAGVERLLRPAGASATADR